MAKGSRPLLPFFFALSRARRRRGPNRQSSADSNAESPPPRDSILIGQALYAAGAALRIFNTYYSIAFIVLVQLNSAVAPRFRRQQAPQC